MSNATQPGFGNKLTVRQAAKAAGLSPVTIYSHIKSGKLKPHEHNGRMWLLGDDVLKLKGSTARKSTTTSTSNGHAGVVKAATTPTTASSATTFTAEKRALVEAWLQTTGKGTLDEYVAAQLNGLYEVLKQALGGVKL